MNEHKWNPEPLGIMVIHGAAVVMEQRALVFLGPSGAGKSTISKILEPLAPVIGDDRLYLVPQENAWFVSDATIRAIQGVLSEEEALNLAGVPLGVVFRLHQSTKSHIAQVDTRQTCRYLISAFYEYYWSSYLDPQIQKTAFTKIAEISRRIPGFDLHFQKSIEIAKEIRHAVSTSLPK